MASSSRHDRDAVSNVLAGAGHTVRLARTAWPAEVDHHVRHIYEKAGVQSPAGTTLFALEHELL
jgi:hypothetical protein